MAALIARLRSSLRQEEETVVDIQLPLDVEMRPRLVTSMLAESDPNDGTDFDRELLTQQVAATG